MKVAAAANARTPEYAKRILQADTCLFCRGGEATQGVHLLYNGKEVWAHYNRYPLPNVGLRTVSITHAAQYVIAPWQHHPNFVSFSLAEVEEIWEALTQRLFGGKTLDVLTLKQAHQPANGTTIPDHCHLQAYGLQQPKQFQLYFGKYPKKPAAAAAVPPFYADQYRLEDKPVARLGWAWEVLPPQRRWAGMAAHHVIQAKAQVRSLKCLGPEDLLSLLEAVAWIERHYDWSNGGVLLYERNQSRTPRPVAFHYFSVMPGSCVRYVHSSAR